MPCVGSRHTTDDIMMDVLGPDLEKLDDRALNGVDYWICRGIPLYFFLAANNISESPLFALLPCDVTAPCIRQDHGSTDRGSIGP